MLRFINTELKSDSESLDSKPDLWKIKTKFDAEWIGKLKKYDSD